MMLTTYTRWYNNITHQRRPSNQLWCTVINKFETRTQINFKRMLIIIISVANNVRSEGAMTCVMCLYLAAYSCVKKRYRCHWPHPLLHPPLPIATHCCLHSSSPSSSTACNCHTRSYQFSLQSLWWAWHTYSGTIPDTYRTAPSWSHPPLAADTLRQSTLILLHLPP